MGVRFSKILGCELNATGFECFKVNHGFVYPVTDVHTQSMGKLWDSSKWTNKKYRGPSVFRFLFMRIHLVLTSQTKKERTYG